jgi:hypothetical protein
MQSQDRSSSSRRRLAQLGVIGVALFSLLAASVAPVFARAPLLDAHKMANYSRNEVLYYKFAGSYPDWLDAAGKGVRLVLETEWDNRTYNTSGLPTFAYSSSGAGLVTYSTAAESPCSDIGNTSWLACASNWGSSSFRIYVRNFAASGKSNWAWNESGGCTSGKTCWDLSRSVLHEAIHVTLGVGNHDESGESKTIMSETQPSSPDSGWNTNHLQPCDDATGALFYDLYSSNARYSKCLNDVIGVPDTGVPTNIAMTGSSFTACTANVVSVGGRAQVAIDTDLRELSENPLTSRRIYWDRRPAGTTAWTTLGSTVADNTSGENFVIALANSSAGTMEYRVRYPGNVSTDFLGASSDTFTIKWVTSPCAI